MTRRRLLQTAGSAITSAFTAEFLPPNLRQATAAGAGYRAASGRLGDVRHVVILMQAAPG